MSKIAIDIDDVLAAHAAGFVTYSNKRWGTNLTVDDYDEHWARMWDIDLEETKKRSDEFHRSGFVSGYAHHEAAIPVLTELAERYELVIVTSRNKLIQQETRDWVAAKYESIFSDIIFAGLWDDFTHRSHLLTKAEICQEIGADYLIDDQIKHCFAAAEKGIHSLLFGDYPWNQSEKLPEGVIRCVDWLAVQEYFHNET